MKSCKRCARSLPEIAFSRRSLASDGLSPRCRKCLSLDRAEFRQRSPEKHEKAKQRRRKWHASRIFTESQREDQRKRSRELYRKNKDSVRNRALMSQYGITLEDYNKAIDAQGGLCAICLCPSGQNPWEKLHVDHCHATGRFRGLLCRRCNTGIGNFKDSPQVLQLAINYLTMGPAT